ncbi:MAG: ABC transporter permease [Spirochaetes bacterium]|nr:ABC transporter permease [Spirochaetota bacterium]
MKLIVKRKINPENLFVNIFSLSVTMGIAFLIVIVLILFLSKDPVKTIRYFFIGPFLNRYYFGNMLNSVIPLIFTGLGIAIAFKASTFNLGGEGQVYSGALAATAVCLALPNANGFIGGGLAIIAAIGVGAVLAGLSGLFKMKWGTDELISSFLISGAVILIVNYFITGPLDDPANNLLATREIAKQYQFMQIFPPSKLDISIYFAVLTAFLVFFFMFYTHQGYEMRMCGLNREFSRYGGIKVKFYLVLPMVLSGSFQGLAGAVSVMGTYHMSVKGFSFGMGWNGIAVALIARNNPLAVIPAAIFFAYIEAGANAAMIHSDVTFEIAAIVESIIYFLITAQVLKDFIRYRKRRPE